MNRISINNVLGLLLQLLIFSCDNSVKDDKATGKVNLVQKDTTVIKNETLKYDPLDTVIIIERYLITDSTDTEFYEPCLNWELSDVDIRKILALSDTISGHDFHYLYYYLPCEIQGKLGLNGDEYIFKLNAGSFVYLSGSDTSFYIGCASQDCEQYFLEKGGIFNEFEE